jgi:hypothetical protein
MIAIKIYGPNPAGLPAAWPAVITRDTETLPPGHDLLFGDEAELQAYLEEHRADYDHWEQQNNLPSPHRVSKDTIMSRIAEHGDEKVIALDDILLQQPRAKQILWRDYAWFESDNENVVQLVQAIGLDPAAILAPDPYL